MLAEHKLSIDNGSYIGEEEDKVLYLEKIGVYFEAENEIRHVPRAVFVDLEAATLESIKAQDLGKIYPKDGNVMGISGAGRS